MSPTDKIHEINQAHKTHGCIGQSMCQAWSCDPSWNEAGRHSFSCFFAGSSCSSRSTTGRGRYKQPSGIARGRRPQEAAGSALRHSSATYPSSSAASPGLPGMSIPFPPLTWPIWTSSVQAFTLSGVTQAACNCCHPTVTRMPPAVSWYQL